MTEKTIRAKLASIKEAKNFLNKQKEIWELNHVPINRLNEKKEQKKHPKFILYVIVNHKTMKELFSTVEHVVVSIQLLFFFVLNA